VTGANGAEPRRIISDETLGYCLLCLQAYKAGTTTKPEYAITSSPVLVPVPGGAIPVPVPACYDHALGGSKQGPSLIVAAGGLS
jgi:hypothetical protein